MIVLLDQICCPILQCGVQVSEDGFGHQHVFAGSDAVLQQAVNDDHILARDLLELPDLAEGSFAKVNDRLQAQVLDVPAGRAGTGCAVS